MLGMDLCQVCKINAQEGEALYKSDDSLLDLCLCRRKILLKGPKFEKAELTWLFQLNI